MITLIIVVADKIRGILPDTMLFQTIDPLLVHAKWSDTFEIKYFQSLDASPDEMLRAFFRPVN